MLEMTSQADTMLTISNQDLENVSRFRPHLLCYSAKILRNSLASMSLPSGPQQLTFGIISNQSLDYASLPVSLCLCAAKWMTS